METLEGLVKRVVGRCARSNALYVHPNVPSRKATNAARKDGIAQGGAAIWVLLDCTVFGSADNNLALCAGGLYVHNDWAGKTSGTHRVPWRDFVQAHIAKDGSYNVYLGAGVCVDIAGAGCGTGPIVQMLTELQQELLKSPHLIDSAN
jgi:hypothetical protein